MGRRHVMDGLFGCLGYACSGLVSRTVTLTSTRSLVHPSCLPGKRGGERGGEAREAREDGGMGLWILLPISCCH
jgi:hypothetical protein